MNEENKALLKTMIAPANYAEFTRYFDGQLWYQICNKGSKIGPEFPVPISDIGTATFLRDDRATMFMRYVRKHLEMLEKAKTEQMASPGDINTLIKQFDDEAPKCSHGKPVHKCDLHLDGHNA